MDTVRILEIKTNLELLDIAVSEVMSDSEDSIIILEQMDELEMELDLLTDQVR